jgi:hypothetical protein
MDITVIPEVKSKAERVSLAGKLPKPIPVYEAERKTLSDAIATYDKKLQKPKVYTQNPTSHAEVRKAIQYRTPSAEVMVSDPLYNKIGKVLGVDTVHEWGKYYDKIYDLAQIAREKGVKEEEIPNFIYKKAGEAPQVGAKRIDDVYTYLRMGTYSNPVKTVTKTVVRYRTRPQENTTTFVNKWIKEALNVNKP